MMLDAQDSEIVAWRHGPRLSAAILALICCMSVRLPAADVVHLRNSDQLTGRLLSADEQELLITLDIAEGQAAKVALHTVVFVELGSGAGFGAKRFKPGVRLINDDLISGQDVTFDGKTLKLTGGAVIPAPFVMGIGFEEECPAGAERDDTYQLHMRGAPAPDDDLYRPEVRLQEMTVADGQLKGIRIGEPHKPDSGPGRFDAALSDVGYILFPEAKPELRELAGARVSVTCHNFDVVSGALRSIDGQTVCIQTICCDRLVLPRPLVREIAFGELAITNGPAGIVIEGDE